MKCLSIALGLVRVINLRSTSRLNRCSRAVTCRTPRHLHQAPRHHGGRRQGLYSPHHRHHHEKAKHHHHRGLDYQQQMESITRRIGNVLTMVSCLHHQLPLRHPHRCHQRQPLRRHQRRHHPYHLLISLITTSFHRNLQAQQLQLPQEQHKILTIIIIIIIT